MKAIVPIVIILCLVLIVSGCRVQSLVAEHDFLYDEAWAGSTTAAKELNGIYNDTSLYLYKNGTWSINPHGFLFWLSVDKGTYTVENGVYILSGFEFNDIECTAIGEMTEDSFDIRISFPNGYRGMTLSFKSFSLSLYIKQRMNAIR